MTPYHQAMLNLNNLLKAAAFHEKHKLKSLAFARNRKLTFPVVAAMILRMIKQSLQITCNWLGDLIGVEPASKQAFSQARQKMSPECFQDMHENGLQTNYGMVPKEVCG
jgi:hypothetical protein